MTAVLMAGAITGLGIFLLVLALLPGRASLARQLAAFDAPYPAAQPVTLPAAWQVPAGGGESEISRWLGAALAAFCARRGWAFPSLRGNLALAGKSLESFLAAKVLLAVLGLLLGPALLCGLALAGIHVSFAVPVWAGLLLATLFFVLPDVEVLRTAEARRRDFRHAVGAFLDLVGMNLSGGRGVPEALLAASEIGAGQAFWRIRDALVSARITGQTPWQALGALGAELRIDELRDLAGALSLVADDGAKVRESLAARAASLRRRELADLAGQAGERSQSMLVAQLLLCLGFLIFLVYPVVRVLLGG